MKEAVMTSIAEMGISLASLVAKSTVSAVNSKIKAIKLEKDVEAIRAKYDEIVNELLLEREEAVRIAQAYKAELDRIEISDEDIVHLHNTVERVLELLKKMNSDIPLESIEQIKELISVDTLKTMQLLGFNYKAAIGEPLTQICANAILSLAKRESPSYQGGSGKNKKR